MSGAPRYDLPEIDDFTRPFWDAAAEGRLLLRRCGACGRAHHYPREFCPHCWSEDVVWEQASGRAVLYTWSVVHRNDLPPFGGRVPYTAAVVDLAEGPRMMTEIVECAEEDLAIGVELEVAFRAAGVPAPGGGEGSGGGGEESSPPPPVPVFRALRQRSAQGQSSSLAQTPASRR
ncbi:Zn-ribbon domain-containing OB-fold protein [Streptomyces sp. NPDC051907]|uniref:Zn-ribbon domain-containing OB-fold protein n=1 Tax=Streptomyces sp. NPDC051907 TaxID=3155284 RepID=UPI0034122D69